MNTTQTADEATRSSIEFQASEEHTCEQWGVADLGGWIRFDEVVPGFADPVVYMRLLWEILG